MSHDLSIREDSRVEFAYAAGEDLPWHGLGQQVPEGSTVDAWRTAAGLDWQIQRSKVRYATSRDATEYLEMPEKHVLFRSDNHHPLGVVSERYKIVQPGEVLDFFRDIVQVGGLQLSAAGALQQGARFWATAKIGEAAPAALRDKIGGYLLLSSSADGSAATEVRRTTIRVVCRNTLAMAMNDKQANTYKISHRSVFQPEAIKGFMELNNAAFEAFVQRLEVLAHKDVRIDRAEDLAVEIIGGKQDVVRASAGFLRVMDLFTKSGMGAREDGVYGTAWGLLNAFTEATDHSARARTAENRMVSSQWGRGDALKQRALNILTTAEV